MVIMHKSTPLSPVSWQHTIPNRVCVLRQPDQLSHQSGTLGSSGQLKATVGRYEMKTREMIEIYIIAILHRDKLILKERNTRGRQKICWKNSKKWTTNPISNFKDIALPEYPTLPCPENNRIHQRTHQTFPYRRAFHAVRICLEFWRRTKLNSFHL